ncbi:hypothetical protein HUJ05_001952 [Dendroctonus ponderosae]|nr:hypothetical protein HUJ05_001952 [Dendroctonus ponderosae]
MLSKAKLRRSVPNWNLQLLEKIRDFLKTRVLQTGANEGRRRHKGNDLGQMLMFGLVAAGLIVIPMGFQFLAVLGGKALLLAKLALILTSIQGLKKIATSNVNYGLYSTGHAAPWHYDRQWFHDGDHYSSSHHPGVAPQVVDYYTHSTPQPPVNYNFSPRGEDYLLT